MIKHRFGPLFTFYARYGMICMKIPVKRKGENAMKRILALALALLLCAVHPLTLAEGENGWYCPRCGRLNYENFCPSDGTARPSDSDAFNGNFYSSAYVDNSTRYSYATGTLNQRLATRTGPSTKYDEPGSFLSAGARVTVHSRSYDSMNEIWWVQVEFTADGERYWAYTGIKRIDGVNLSGILEEEQIGECTVNQSTPCYYGPSYDYKQIKRNVPAGVKCKIFGYVYNDPSDFIQIEFYDSGAGCLRRAWVPDWSVDNYYMYNGF